MAGKPAVQIQDSEDAPDLHPGSTGLVSLAGRRRLRELTIEDPLRSCPQELAVGFGGRSRRDSQDGAARVGGDHPVRVGYLLHRIFASADRSDPLAYGLAKH